MALQPTQHRQHGSDEVAGGLTVPICLGDQVHGDLGVGVAGKLHAGLLQLVAQGGEVLDDAVVDDGDLAGGVAMRVCVAVGGTAVGRPAGVPQAGGAAQGPRRHLGDRVLEVLQPAGTATDGEFALVVNQSDSRRVVAPVLHPAQCVHDDSAGGGLPDISDDSAHSDQGNAAGVAGPATRDANGVLRRRPVCAEGGIWPELSP